MWRRAQGARRARAHTVSLPLATDVGTQVASGLAMHRLLRLLVPVSLSALSTGALILACSHRGDAPANPRPEPIDPSGQPMAQPGGPAMPGGGPAAEVGGAPSDAGVDGPLGMAPPPGQPLSAVMRGTYGATIVLAAQPGTPAAPPPGGAPTQPRPAQPGQPPPPSQQPAPGQPTPGSPGSPSAPGAPRPGAGAPRDAGVGPSDGGVGDAGVPRLPSVNDGGVSGGDGGMQPILRRGR